MFDHTKKSEKSSLFVRAFRSLFAVTILTSLVLGISFLVKELSTVDSQKIVEYSTPLLTKVGIDENVVGEVAGKFSSRVSEATNTDTELNSDSEVLYTVCIMSDAENDFDNLSIALSKCVNLNSNAIVFLGDLTNWGDEESMLKVKNALESTGLEYYVIPGDHDLAKSVSEGDTNGLSIFTSVFGANYNKLVLGDSTLILLDNSANYSLISPTNINWFTSQIQFADYVFLSQPLYHPIQARVMGVVDGEVTENVRGQALTILDLIRNSKVKAIFAGDHHLSSRNGDTEREGLMHYVVGAITQERNLQDPRFSLLSLLDDGSYKVEDIILAE